MKGRHAPVEVLVREGLELVALGPPGAPGGVLGAGAIRNLVLLVGHVAPDILLPPVVAEVVNLAAGVTRAQSERKRW